MTESAAILSAEPDVSVAAPAFRAGPRVCSLDDILAAAEARGDLGQFRTDWASRQAAAATAETAGLTPEQADIQAATDAFRYARDLVSAEECERWLAQRGLTFEDLTASVTRRLQAELATQEGGLSSPQSAAGLQPAEAVTEGQPSEDVPDKNNATKAADWKIRAPGQAFTDDEPASRGTAGCKPAAPSPADDECFRTDALLADEFTGWARGLAWRLALAREHKSLPTDNAAPADAWSELEERFTAACAALATPERRRRELAAQRLQLLRLELTAAEFESEAAAREAFLCAREDGTTLADVAAANGFPVASHSVFLGELTADWQQALVSARPGDVTPPLPGDGLAVVLQLLGKREPSLDDPAVCARLDAELRRQHFGELEARHIRWLINVEVGE